MKTETQPLRLGDILKSEADVNTRTYIVKDNVKIGDVVSYRNHDDTTRPLIALSNSEHGKVLVQPFNCEINLNALDQEKIKPSVADLISQGEKFGIKYVEEITVNSDSSSTNTASTTTEDNTATTNTTTEDNNSPTTETATDTQSQQKTKELWASKFRNAQPYPVNERDGIYFFGNDEYDGYASIYAGEGQNVFENMRSELVDDISPFTENDFWFNHQPM